MKNKREWYGGLNTPSMVIMILIVTVGVIVWPLWCAGGAIVVAVMVADHILWNLSDNETKYEYTGPFCGFRMLFK